MKRTKTIDLEETNFLISVEVDEDCEVVEANLFVIHMESDPIKCTQAVKSSNFYLKQIEEQFSTLDWNDKGDEVAS